MKILHIHPSLAGGGIEAMICGLVNEMTHMGHTVHVCTIFKPEIGDIFYHKLDPHVAKISIGKIKPGFSLKEVFKIYRIIKQGHYKVVHIHGFFYYYVLAVLLLHKRVKFFYTIHSDAYMENAKWDRQIFWLKKICFQKGYIHPIAISNVSQASFTSLYHCSSDLVYNGVPLPHITNEIPAIIKKSKITKDTLTLLHPGRIDTPKNQLVLCKVCQRLIDEGENIVLLIAGTKQNEGIYKTIKPYFSDRIQYIGERSDIPELLHASDAMCLPSIWEGLPVTLLEALSVGCIPICSPVGGIINVIHDGVNGFLSKSSSETDYYDTLRRFLHLSPADRTIIQKNCSTSFVRFDITHTTSEYIALYERY
ncbi:MAG: glycosyltransferase family 4 protein [Muribaculaceae bacterium]